MPEKKASVPAVVQLSEQSARIGTTYILYLIFLSEGRPITALIAAGGSLAGETAASLVSLLVVPFISEITLYTKRLPSGSFR